MYERCVAGCFCPKRFMDIGLHGYQSVDADISKVFKTAHPGNCGNACANKFRCVDPSKVCSVVTEAPVIHLASEE